MGAKLKSQNETTCAHMDLQNQGLINLHNWRALREWKHEGIDGLFVFIKTFRVYFIPGYTMEMLHEANYCNKTLDIPYQYIKNVLPCELCNGDAKTDWVEAARGPAPKKQRHGYRPTFYRWRRGPIHIIEIEVNEAPYYFSSINLHKGEEVCKKCHGSGLQLATEWPAFQTIHLENS